MLGPLVLPKALSGAGEHLTRAVREVELLATWPEGVKFEPAIQPRAIANALIGAFHTHLVNARIEYLFRENLERRGRVRLGVASRAAGKLSYLAEVDFVIEFNWTYWAKLTPPQRIALVDHELCHCSRDDDGNWTMRSHDVEEFSEIVSRWGLWTPDLRIFNSALKNAQVDLFAEGAVVAGVAEG
jgi:hypothetical protein